METKVFLPYGLLIWQEGKMLINQHFSNQHLGVTKQCSNRSVR